MIEVRAAMAATFLAGSSAVVAQPYKLMDLSSETMQSIDSGSVKKAGDIANVWMFTHYWRPQPFGDKVMTLIKSRVEIDCANNRMRLTAIHFFADRTTPLPSSDDKTSPWNSIIPDAWVMKVRNAACDGTYGLMGKMNWDDYEFMLSTNRDIARQTYPSIP
ncbi:hypothetical protein OSJ57_26155 [Sphingomonas sp. HH69]